MGTMEESVLILRQDLYDRFQIIMNETQMDTNELIEHFFELYNSNVEKLWSESDETKKIKKLGLQKETEYWMKKILSKSEQQKMFGKSTVSSDNSEKNNDNDSNNQEDGTADKSGVVGETTPVQGNSNDVTVPEEIPDSLPLLHIPKFSEKIPSSNRIILTLPDNLLRKDISINIGSKKSKNKQKRKEVSNQLFRESAWKGENSQENIMPESSNYTDTTQQEENSQPDKDPLTSDENKTAEMPLSVETNGSGGMLSPGSIKQEAFDMYEEEDAMQSHYTNIQPMNMDGAVSTEQDDAEETEDYPAGGAFEYESFSVTNQDMDDDENLEMTVDTIDGNYHDDSKYVRDIALNIAKNMAVTENGETVFNCNFCNYKTSVIGRLRRHITVHTGKEFKCPYCDKDYTEKCKLKEHIKVKHEKSVSYPCSKCPKKFTSKRGREYHNITYHEERGTVLKCSFCPKEFSSRFGFTYHTKTVHGENKVEENFESTKETLLPMTKWEKSTLKKGDKEYPKDKEGNYSCKMCDYKTPRMFHIKRHLSVHYGNTNKCSECEKTFSDPYKLRIHIQVKHGTLRFDCPQCGKSFGTKEGLKYHRLTTHEGNWKYLCTECGKCFYQKHHFEGHMNKHKGIKAFECKDCGQKFTYRSDVSIHKKHCGQEKRPPLEKPEFFVCHVCGDQFKKKSVLSEHVMGKHGNEGVYNCQCGVSFKWRNSLRQHKQRCTVALSAASNVEINPDVVEFQIRKDLEESSSPFLAGPSSVMSNEAKDDTMYDITEEEMEQEQDTEFMNLTEHTDIKDEEGVSPSRTDEPTDLSIRLYQVSDSNNGATHISSSDDDDMSESNEDILSARDIFFSESSSDDIDFLHVPEIPKSSFIWRQETITHQKGKKYNCSSCGKDFENQFRYQRHKKMCHQRKSEKRQVLEMFVCAFCDGRFSQKSHLRDHIIQKHGIKGKRKMTKKYTQHHTNNACDAKNDDVNSNLTGKDITSENIKSSNNNTTSDTVEHNTCDEDRQPETSFQTESLDKPSMFCQEETPEKPADSSSSMEDHVESEMYLIDNNNKNCKSKGISSNYIMSLNDIGEVTYESVEKLSNSVEEHEKTMLFDSADDGLMEGDTQPPLTEGDVSVIDLTNVPVMNSVRTCYTDLHMTSPDRSDNTTRGNDRDIEISYINGNRKTGPSLEREEIDLTRCLGIDGSQLSEDSKHSSSVLSGFSKSTQNSTFVANGDMQIKPISSPAKINAHDVLKCKYCGDQFTKQSYLREHILGKHNNKQRYTCPCGEHFKWRSSLNSHREKCVFSGRFAGLKTRLIKKDTVSNESFPSSQHRNHLLDKTETSSSHNLIDLSNKTAVLEQTHPQQREENVESLIRLQSQKTSNPTSIKSKFETPSGNVSTPLVSSSGEVTSHAGNMPMLMNSFQTFHQFFSNRHLQEHRKGSTQTTQENTASMALFQLRNLQQQNMASNLTLDTKARFGDSFVNKPPVSDTLPVHAVDIKKEVTEESESCDVTQSTDTSYRIPSIMHLFKNRGEQSLSFPELISRSTYTCSICSMALNTPKQFSEHMEIHGKKFVCSNCKMTFQHEIGLQSHFRVCKAMPKIISQGREIYRCKTCGDTFTMKGYLREHEQGKHGSNKRYSCACGLAFKWRSSLGGHQRRCPMSGKYIGHPFR